MVVCGISGRRRRAAAALAVDGRLVAASSEAAVSGVPHAGFGGAALPEAAVRACLAAAGLTAADVTHVVSAEGPGAGGGAARLARRVRAVGALGGAAAASGYQMSRLAAHAQLGRTASASGPVLVADASGAAIFGAGAPGCADLPDVRALLGLAAHLSTALGMSADDPCDAIGALEHLAGNEDGRARPWFAGLVAIDGAAPVIHASVFGDALAKAEAEAGARLVDAATPLVRAQRVRAELAHAFLEVVAGSIARAAEGAGTGIVLAGSAFASPDLVARVRDAATVPLLLAPCAHWEGAAAGAALGLEAVGPGAVPESLALGAPVTEQDAKSVLENCRLDYLYEPRWPRLFDRVSRVLERGKLVAWFQGPAEFGDPLYGSRSILCDPSNRYARDNVNQYLRHLPLSSPIPLSLPPASASSVDATRLSPWAFSRTTVEPEWREALRGAADARARVHAHVLTTGGPFAELLDTHRQRTGVPGLLNVRLGDPGQTGSCSARDAIRAVFASSVDALVIHRFVVMKDYWQMRVDE